MPAQVFSCLEGENQDAGGPRECVNVTKIALQGFAGHCIGNDMSRKGQEIVQVALLRSVQDADDQRQWGPFWGTGLSDSFANGKLQSDGHRSSLVAL